MEATTKVGWVVCFVDEVAECRHIVVVQAQVFVLDGVVVDIIEADRGFSTLVKHTAHARLTLTLACSREKNRKSILARARKIMKSVLATLRLIGDRALIMELHRSLVNQKVETGFEKALTAASGWPNRIELLLTIFVLVIVIELGAV